MELLVTLFLANCEDVSLAAVSPPWDRWKVALAGLMSPL